VLIVANFDYKGLNAQGKSVKGSLVANSRDAAVTMLQQQGLTPMQVTEQKKVAQAQSKVGSKEIKGRPSIFVSNQLTSKQLTLITRQLATLINAHLPVNEALHVLVNQTRKKNVRAVLLTIQQQINDGQSLATAMAMASSSFTQAYTATIAAGEKSGQLGPVLQRLADYSQVMQQTRSRIQIALIYPAIIALVSLAVISLLVVYVVPQVAEVIVSMDQELPAITKGLIGLSQFLQDKLLIILLAGLSIALLYSMLMRHAGVRMLVHRFWLSVPGLSHLIKTYLAARFCKTLAMLYDSGNPIVDAVESAKAVVQNDYMAHHIEQARQQIHEGKGFLSAFSKRPVLPLIALHLIASGQANGQLATMLDKAANDLEQQLQNTITAMLALIEPLMMLVMGGIVLVIVMAVMVPILDMNQLMM